jgi:hypothetical protein
MEGLDVALIRLRRKLSGRGGAPARDDARAGESLYMTENTQ